MIPLLDSLGGAMELLSFCAHKKLLKIAKIFLLALVFAITYPPPCKAETLCNIDSIYGISWTKGECTCLADTVGKNPNKPFAEDTIGSINGWIDKRDLTCDPKSKQWNPNKIIKFAKCDGCTKTFNACCGRAHLGKFKTTPSNGLCGAGTPTKVTLKNGRFTWLCQGVGGGGNSICEGYKK